MKRLLAFVAKNWLTSGVGVCELAGAGVAIWRDPTRLMDPAVVTALFTGLLLVLSRDPSRVQNLLARLSGSSVPTSGMDAADERKN